MLVIPAVDLKDGKAVRLVQGRADRQTVYDEDPVRAARRWADEGATRIHIVDLDGAFEGRPRNAAVTRRILQALEGLEVEVGGGLRTPESVAELLDAGAARCVIGTKAVEDRAFLKRLAETHPGRIILGLDAKNGLVATKGWVEVSELKATDLLAEVAALPLAEVIYTDIETDGMLQGPNFQRLAEVRAVSAFPVIASGGVATAEHLRRLAGDGCFGAIVGKALFDGRLTLREAFEAAAGDSTRDS
ncbi:MAG: 1-(5-phosphoribosyl)-5-[(5-phosphoribosylamino)methylideneamino]imidazole-4-carboxamide isomerase [Planctomycetota bacterium]|nr:1-(5-phosphoribosyl)-5-[(5-phosphoribosylamino)methylideneamino]imidazole-4-carboxamide isomerase [Planctomycetota bacterium]